MTATHGQPGRPGRLLLRAILMLLATTSAALADHLTSVTITQKAPLEELSPTGEVTGVSESAVGAHYALVSVANGQLTLRDPQGNQVRIETAATDFVAPAPAASTPAPAASAPAASPAASTHTVNPATPAVTPSAPAATVASPALAPALTVPVSPTPAGSPANPTIDTVNAAFGKPLFSSQSLWQETALLLAQRLGLGLEGRTNWEASYRRYFSGQSNDTRALMLGVGVYCVAVYADADDHPTSLLMAFANDGDFRGVGQVATDLYQLEHPGTGDSSEDLEKRKQEFYNEYLSMEATFEPTRKAEESSLTEALTRLFGEPRQTVFGTDEVTKENTLRWDWNDVSFLLTCQPTKYDLLRVVPVALADNDGRTERIPRDDIGKKLSEAVEHRPNGDVVITQIPMADQGPKGYCVPATWERVLRYTGVPGDMYTLSRIGKAGFGGGEAGASIAQQLDETLYDYGRHVQVLTPEKLDYIAVRHYIDDGVPIFWGVNVHGYEPAEQRYALCDRDKDWDGWKKLLDQTRATTPEHQPSLPAIQGHQVLITGYNPETKEIAWSDPWGRSTQERWMTQEEAQRCSLNQFYIITW